MHAFLKLCPCTRALGLPQLKNLWRFSLFSVIVFLHFIVFFVVRHWFVLQVLSLYVAIVMFAVRMICTIHTNWQTISANLCHFVSETFAPFPLDLDLDRMKKPQHWEGNGVFQQNLTRVFCRVAWCYLQLSSRHYWSCFEDKLLHASPISGKKRCVTISTLRLKILW